jgi:formiminoglutamase
MVLHNDPNWMRAGHWFKDAGSGDIGILGVGASKSAITPNKSFLTPDAIRQALLKYSTYFADANIDLAEKLSAVDFGNVADPDSQVASIDAISKVSAKTLILLGGDNSITYSGVCALANKVDFKNIGLITLDAHHDLRDGVSNGSPIKQLLDVGLPGKQIVQIGINDFANSKFYAERAKAAGIKVIHRNKINESTIDSIVKDAFDSLANCSHIYLDIDIDVCNRAEVPAAPASMPGGISANELLNLVFKIALDKRVSNFDITEIDASIDAADNRTVRLAALSILRIAAAKAV